MTASTLTSTRLTLGALSLCDAPFVLSLLANREVRQYLGGPVPVSSRLSVLFGYARSVHGEATWTVRTKLPAEPIGLIFISKHRDGVDFELSYQFRPSSWGKGFAFEAASEALRFAATQMGHQRVIAETQVSNERSCRLLEKLGLTHVRTLKRFGALQAIYST